MKMEGKTVLITGASSGIGEATAMAIARKGGKLVLLARDKTRLQRVASEISAQGGEAISFPADLSDAEAISTIAKIIIAERGIPDIIINNAGAGRWLSVEETPAAEVEQMMAVPYFAAFNLAREFLPHMLKRGTGHIANISSVASRVVWPGAAAYTAARWAISGFSKALQTELRSSGVKITLAIFGNVSSTFWIHNPGSEERLPKIDRLIPTLTPEQAAQAIVYGIERNAREIVRPGIFRLIFLLNALFPRTTELVLRIGWHGSRVSRK
jgi:short-subunit dehydrogenase